ncbi:MAG: NACHT domain-containing protein [Microcystaceae cyanobacterium]
MQRPFSGVAEFSDAPGQALPEGTQATKVFEQMGEGRTLLILGEPGAGKTITLLKLAEDLIVRTEPDLRQPIPVVFNLSSWARKPQTIKQWLVQELLEKYQVSKALGKAWVETEALILLLDGLDEVKAEQRNACVQALNQFLQTHGTTEIAICCRIRDYQVLTDRLRLRSAICIQPLTPEQVKSYFEQAGEQLSALKTVLQQDGELQELATSPLMLSIMSLAYQDCTREEITQGGRTEDYRKRLFENYIDRMFQRRGTTQQYLR